MSTTSDTTSPASQAASVGDGAHTPTPWLIYEQPVNSAEDARRELCEQVDKTASVGGILYLLESGGKCPATTGCGPRSKANAELVVKAVNNHDALVKALTDILEANKDFRDGLPQSWDGDPLQDACDAAAKLLAATENKRG